MAGDRMDFSGGSERTRSKHNGVKGEWKKIGGKCDLKQENCGSNGSLGSCCVKLLRFKQSELELESNNSALEPAAPVADKLIACRLGHNGVVGGQNDTDQSIIDQGLLKCTVCKKSFKDALSFNFHIIHCISNGMSVDLVPIPEHSHELFHRYPSFTPKVVTEVELNSISIFNGIFSPKTCGIQLKNLKMSTKSKVSSSPPDPTKNKRKRNSEVIKSLKKDEKGSVKFYEEKYISPPVRKRRKRDDERGNEIEEVVNETNDLKGGDESPAANLGKGDEQILEGGEGCKSSKKGNGGEVLKGAEGIEKERFKGNEERGTSLFNKVCELCQRTFLKKDVFKYHVWFCKGIDDKSDKMEALLKKCRKKSESEARASEKAKVSVQSTSSSNELEIISSPLEKLPPQVASPLAKDITTCENDRIKEPPSLEDVRKEVKEKTKNLTDVTVSVVTLPVTVSVVTDGCNFNSAEVEIKSGQIEHLREKLRVLQKKIKVLAPRCGSASEDKANGTLTKPEKSEMTVPEKRESQVENRVEIMPIEISPFETQKKNAERKKGWPSLVELESRVIDGNYTNNGLLLQDNQAFKRPSIEAKQLENVMPYRRSERRKYKQKFRCNQCSASFSTKGDRLDHIKTIHEIEKPFPCCKCDLRFSFEFRLKRHMKVHLYDE